jgi:NAD(P)H-dependent flavin oxidoreductase YrpB (nitropropane dioxygenase family)
VQSLSQARQVLQQGADIIVAQGSETGGHGETADLGMRQSGVVLNPSWS